MVVVLAFFGIMMLAFIGVLLITYKISEGCSKHNYTRIDYCNDKNIILVCQKCGKLKKLRK